MQHDLVLIKLNLTFWPQHKSQGWGRSAGKIFATTLLHSWFPLIWHATWPCSYKVSFRPFDPNQSGVWAVCRQHICYQCCCIHDSFLFDMQHDITMFWKSWLLSWAWGESVGKIFPTMLLHFVIPLNLICNMTMFWNSWLLTYWRGQGHGGSVGKIFATM